MEQGRWEGSNVSGVLTYPIERDQTQPTQTRIRLRNFNRFNHFGVLRSVVLGSEEARVCRIQLERPSIHLDILDLVQSCRSLYGWTWILCGHAYVHEAHVSSCSGPMLRANDCEVVKSRVNRGATWKRCQVRRSRDRRPKEDQELRALNQANNIARGTQGIRAHNTIQILDTKQPRAVVE
jgi:hypothetical protein